jgi:glycosyltransferase involved in cell wall biosynthesis
MKITWVTRSFLDYRIPVYKAISEIEDVNFMLISSKEESANPRRCIVEAEKVLGAQFKSLPGEKVFGRPYSPDQRSNSVLRIFWQPGLISQIKKNNPDIIITDAFNHWTLPVFLLKMWGYKFKHILCYERTEHTERNAPFLKRIFISKMKHLINAVHCNGILCKDFLTKLKYPENKLKLGNMAADSKGLMRGIKKLSSDDSFNIKQRYNIRGATYIYVGQLIPRKGMKELILGWIDAKLPAATLLIVGDGSQKKELEEIIKLNNITNVIFLGAINHHEIVIYYNVADCFIIPTLEDNWSLVVPEAMACGLPIICSKYNGCFPELVTQENGWVFDPLVNDSIVNVLSDSYEKKNDFQKMGSASKKIQRNFTPNVIAEKIYQTCNELLNKN